MIEKESTNRSEPILQEDEASPVKLRTYHFVRTILVGFIVVSIVNVIFSYIFYTPKAQQIDQGNIEMVAKYELLNERIAVLRRRLESVTYRDNATYRSLFGLEPLDMDRTSYPRSKYESLEGDPYSSILIDSWRDVDILAKEIYQQSLSLDELQLFAENKEAFAAAIPAVWPIDRTKLKWGIGAFGMRFHPIYKRRIMHKGIDLACDKGSPIYATADGVVEHSVQGYRRSGYGQSVLLRHGFGYKTRYAHMSERLVKAGDTVRRGDLIGLIGSTGGSTGPHLHYEVILNGEVVNPLSYFNREMSKEEYQLLMEQVSESNIRESR